MKPAASEELYRQHKVNLKVIGQQYSENSAYSAKESPIQNNATKLGWLKIILGLIAGATLAGQAQATILEFDYATEFSGGQAPSGPTPWAISTVDDGGSAGSVTLTMSLSSLASTANISGMYFNLDPSLNPANLTFTYLGSSTGPAATSIQTGTDSFKADGDGMYDILFNFPTGSGFNAGDTVSYTISGIPTLTANSFNVLSACGNPNCVGPGAWYAAAHVQNTTGAGSGGSGWIGSHEGVVPPTSVPIPAALWLFGSGLFGLVSVSRRKNSARA